MKKFSFILLLTGLAFMAGATHITGGEMFYSYNGIVNGQPQYTVTLKLYQRCNSGRQFPNPAIVSIFDKTSNNRFNDLFIPISLTEQISITSPDPCITNPPPVCYDVAYYTFTVDLPPSAGGYVLASQVNYRINVITNLSGSQIGATYTAEIPGTLSTTNAFENNSATFTGSDLVIVCANNDFSYSFAAEDVDGDQLSYTFCEAYASTSGSGGAATPTGPPPFPSVPYSTPFAGTSPLGAGITINPLTGLLTGIAPDDGVYVVTVCVQEIRNGVVIATQRKDLQINIASCDIAAASLLPEYQLCGNTQTITINNLSSSPLIVSYKWNVVDKAGTTLFSTSTSSLIYTFADTGLYSVQLVINPDQACTDSTQTLVRVYPGFTPAFAFSGICINKPTLFDDQSTSVYGTVNSWVWDFGVVASSSDVSNLPNPNFTYSGMGANNVTLVVTDSKGCRDTAVNTVTIIDKPPITLDFRDTLICKNDNVQLLAGGSGLFSWSPVTSIRDANTASPTVFPPVTTFYTVELNDNGCINRDSVRVRVVDKVTLQAMNDTTICQGDTIQLRINSDGFLYSWTPAGQVSLSTLKNPMAVTNSTTDYQVTAFLGGCIATDQIKVTTIPYPYANAGPDSTICFRTPASLRGITDGNRWQWAPGFSLDNPSLLNPTATPLQTTAYVFSVLDNKGCPKPGRDTIIIYVLPEMFVSGGNDTSIIVGQPLQLNGTGGEFYEWSPPAYLSATNIANPIAVINSVTEDIQYKLVASSASGCKDSAYITIKVFATGPTIFVPTAFTPNNDGKNDFLRPLAVGMKE
ncbi:MAG TPA: PKD domain-containing protein, partial [Chitinophagaceae bacterium]|nr:PKD domain-containing protein [Chitinophagaceae bacterium]